MAASDGDASVRGEARACVAPRCPVVKARTRNGEYSLTTRSLSRNHNAVRILDGHGAAGREHRYGFPANPAVSAKRTHTFGAGHR